MALSRGRGNPWRRRRYSLVWLLLAGGLAWLLRPYLDRLPGNQAAPLIEARDATIERVVDGDTLVLVDGTRLRLIGIDTPETVKPQHPVEPFGQEATAFTKRFVSRGAVRLEFDREKRDQYGRLLVYVWVEQQMLNEELVRAGLARVEPKYSFAAARKQRLLALEAEAKAARRGIWSLP